MTNEVKIRLFVSYSHIDEDWKNKLQGHLAFLRQYGDMAEIWHDRKITGGSEWDFMISKALQEANIFLLLISSDFLASKYCSYIEFNEAMKRHENEEAVVIPVIIRDVDWQWREKENVKGLVDLNALPTDGKAITNHTHWDSPDEGFTVVAKGIKAVVTELTTKPPLDVTHLTQAQKVAAKFFATSAVSTGKVSGSVSDNNHFNKIYIALSSLNFIEQKKKFGEFLDSGNRIGAFLLHGRPRLGQDWILNELLRRLPEDAISTARPFKFDFGRKFGGTLEDLWYELGVWVGVDSSEPDKIAEAIYTLWQTQTLIFVLRDVKPDEQHYVQEFLHAFWYPLLKKAPAKLSDLLNYCMLFFVSYNDCKGKLALTKQVEPDWGISCPIELEALTKFSLSELQRWRDGEYGRLHSSVTVEKILENSDNGLPELVLRNICKLNGDNWKKREEAWIRY